MGLIPDDRTLGWTPYAWLVYIVPFALSPVYTPRLHGAGGWILVTGATLAFLALYLRSYWVRGRELVLVTTATTALAVAFWPLAHGAGAMFIFAAGMIAHLEPGLRAAAGVAVIALVAAGEALLLRRGLFEGWWPVAFALLIGAINMHYSQVTRSNTRLRLAREEIEHLAKVAERERIARDLHDLLGHTLSLIVLKSELATKLADRDPARARSEIADVERISRDALAEVRAAVTGYRSGGIHTEAEHARAALATAGVRVDCELSRATLPPTHEAVLALALREAATNIVRHSGASRCSIDLAVTAGDCTLTVADDGRGGSAPFGSGLSGMRERVEILGGTMQRDGENGTTLTVTLPLARIEERSA